LPVSMTDRIAGSNKTDCGAVLPTQALETSITNSEGNRIHASMYCAAPKHYLRFLFALHSIMKMAD